MTIVRPSEKKRIAGRFTQFSAVVFVAGSTFILTALSGILFAILPFALLQSEWQLRLCSAVLGSCSSLLLGSLLVCAGPLLNPDDKIFKKWSNLVRNACTLFAMVLLLIIPLQMFAGSQSLSEVRLSEVETLKQRRLVIYQISKLTSESELRNFVSSLPDQPSIPPQLDSPFDVIKARVLDNLNTSYKKLEFDAKNIQDLRIQRFLIEASRNMVQALLMAIAFYFLSGNAPSLYTFKHNLITFRKRFTGN